MGMGYTEHSLVTSIVNGRSANVRSQQQREAGEIIQEFGLEILHPGANYASIPLTTLDVNRPACL